MDAVINFFITVFYIDKFKANTPRKKKAYKTRFEEFKVKCMVHSYYYNL